MNGVKNIQDDEVWARIKGNSDYRLHQKYVGSIANGYSLSQKLCVCRVCVWEGSVEDSEAVCVYLYIFVLAWIHPLIHVVSFYVFMRERTEFAGVSVASSATEGSRRLASHPQARVQQACSASKDSSQVPRHSICIAFTRSNIIKDSRSSCTY